MTDVTQVGFLIDFNSFPILTTLRTNLNNSRTANGLPEFDRSHVSSSTAHVPGFSTPSTALVPLSSAGPSSTSRDRGQRYCTYPAALEAYNKTPPRRPRPLALDSESDYSEDEEWPDSELKQAREDQIAENLQCVKEIILERLYKASLVRGKVETDNVQWSYQFFDSSQEVIKTKNNQKKFCTLDAEAIESFEQILEQELNAFVRGKRKLEKKRKKMLTNGESYYLPEESNRLTCLSNALKNIMSDIQWIDESGPKTTQYNNILYILHHLPANEREVNNFANGHIPVGKSLHQKLLRDALLPPAFLQVLRDKLKIKLNFIDISKIGQPSQALSNSLLMLEGSSAAEKNGQEREDEMDEADRKSVLVTQKMLQMIHAKYETRPERHVIPLEFGTWYTMLKAVIEGAGLRAESRKTGLVASGQKCMVVVPFVEKKEKPGKDKHRLSAESGPLPRKEFEARRRSERRRDREGTMPTPDDLPSLALQVAEVSPTVKVGHWLGNDSLFSPGDQLESVSRDGASDPPISVDSFDIEEYGYGHGFGVGMSGQKAKGRYGPYRRREPQQQAIEYQPKLAIKPGSSNANNSSHFDQDRLSASQSARPSTSKASRELLKRNSSGNIEEKERRPPNTSFIKMQNPRKPLEITVHSKAPNANARAGGQQQRKTKGLEIGPFTQFEGGYGTRLRSKIHNEPKAQQLPLLALPEPGRKPVSVSAIAYVPPAPKPPDVMDIVPINKAATSPPNRLNVKRNLRDAFNSFSADRGAGANQASASQRYGKASASANSKTGSAKKRSAVQQRGRPPASQSRVLKSKRKLQMDDDESEDTVTSTAKAGPSRQSQSSYARSRWDVLASALKMDQPTPTPTTPQRKRLKRLNDNSVEKDRTVVQESPQVTQRGTRTRRRGGGGLSKVDPVSFYSFGSNESKAWEISGQKMVAERLKESVEDSKGLLAELSTRTIEMDYDDFEILGSSSPECGDESNKKREKEVEDSVKYFHLQRQRPNASPLVLFSTPPEKTGDKEDKDVSPPNSPCLMKHFVMPALSRSDTPKKTRVQAGQLAKEKRESEEKEKNSEEKTPESTSVLPLPLKSPVPETTPSSAANSNAKATLTPPAPSTSTSTLVLATPAFDGQKLIKTTTPASISKITPPPRKAKARGAASTAAMTASFSSTSSSDCATPAGMGIDIDALVNREILNTPTPRRRAAAAVTVSAAQMASLKHALAVNTSPTPPRGHGQTSGVPVSRRRLVPPSPDILDLPMPKPKLDLFSPDMIPDDDDDDQGAEPAGVKSRYRPLSLSPDVRADIDLVVKRSKRTPKITAAKRKLTLAQAKAQAGPQTPTTPVQPSPSSAPLSILSPSPARTPRNLRQFTPVKPDSGASSSSTASTRQFLYSDTTPDKLPDLENFFSGLSQGRRHGPLVLCSPTSSPAAAQEHKEDAETETNETQSLAASTALATASTNKATTTSTPTAGTKKKRKRRKKSADWGLTKRKKKKKNSKSGSRSGTGTEQHTDESSSFGYTPTPSPVNDSAAGNRDGMGHRQRKRNPFDFEDDEDQDDLSASP